MLTRRIFHISWMAAVEIINVIVKNVSLGKCQITVGRYIPFFKVFHNWCFTYFVKFPNFYTPKRISDIQEIVRKYSKVRAIGAGHSYNVLYEKAEAYISLNKLRSVEIIDQQTCRAQAGIGLRSLQNYLWKHNLTLGLSNSYDSQKLGGLVATDTRGTSTKGRNTIGSITLEAVVVTGNGEVKTFKKGSDELKAVIGGCGAIGIVVEVVLECRPAFRRNLVRSNMTVEAFLDSHKEIANDNTNLNMFSLSGSRILTVDTWKTDTSTRRWLNVHSLFGVIKKRWLDTVSVFIIILIRFLYPLNLHHFVEKLFANYGNATIYHLPTHRAHILHYYPVTQVMEYAIPIGKFRDCCKTIHKIMETMVRDSMTMLDVKIIKKESHSFLSPSCQFDAAFMEWSSFEVKHKLNDEVVVAIEKVLIESSGIPHLGKRIENFVSDNYRKEIPEAFKRFQEIREQHDPYKKFLTSRLEKIFC